MCVYLSTEAGTKLVHLDGNVSVSAEASVQVGDQSGSQYRLGLVCWHFLLSVPLTLDLTGVKLVQVCGETAVVVV